MPETFLFGNMYQCLAGKETMSGVCILEDGACWPPVSRYGSTHDGKFAPARLQSPASATGRRARQGRGLTNLSCGLLGHEVIVAHLPPFNAYCALIHMFEGAERPCRPQRLSVTSAIDFQGRAPLRNRSRTTTTA